MSPLVEVSHLEFGYGSQPVLQDINFTVERGTTLGLIGPNGGGKTTLIKLMLGLLKPSRGSVKVDGLSPAQAVAAGDRIGYLAQQPPRARGFPLDVRQIVMLGLAGRTGLLRPYAPDDLAFVESLLRRLNLLDIMHQPVSDLSGGQLQRVYMARALVNRPKLLVLDEPTVGVDRAHQQRFIELISELRQEMSLTLVFVSHDLRAVTSMSNRIACLNLNLHYHDVPERLPSDLVYKMFACDLEALGLGCNHDHPHTHPTVSPKA